MVGKIDVGEAYFKDVVLSADEKLKLKSHNTFLLYKETGMLLMELSSTPINIHKEYLYSFKNSSGKYLVCIAQFSIS